MNGRSTHFSDSSRSDQVLQLHQNLRVKPCAGVVGASSLTIGFVLDMAEEQLKGDEEIFFL